MAKDRVVGVAHQVKGKVKETAGKVTGDAKTEAEGAAEKAAGRVQNAVGGAKDAMREAAEKKLPTTPTAASYGAVGVWRRLPIENPTAPAIRSGNRASLRGRRSRRSGQFALHPLTPAIWCLQTLLCPYWCSFLLSFG